MAIILSVEVVNPRLGDRVMSVNETSLLGADYMTAVRVLRDAGPTLNLVVRRNVDKPKKEGDDDIIRVKLKKGKG